MYAISTFFALAPIILFAHAAPLSCEIKKDDCAKIDWNKVPSTISNPTPMYCKDGDFCWNDVATYGTCQVTLTWHKDTVKPASYSRDALKSRVGSMLLPEKGCPGGWRWMDDETRYRENYHVYIKPYGVDPVDFDV